MDDSARAVLAVAARRQGRELAGLAYLVLQNRIASEEAAAAGLADVVRAGDDAFASATVGAVLRRALEAHPHIREIDAPGDATPPALTRLSPLQRAVAGGHLLGRVPLETLAPPLGLSVDRLRHELLAAAKTPADRDQLHGALSSALEGRAFAITADDVEAAITLLPPRPIGEGRGRLWLAGAAAAAALVAVGLVAGGQPPASPSVASSGSPLAAAVAGAFPPGGPQGAGAWAGTTRLSLGDGLTLADCDIQPATTPIAFRGWLTLGALSTAARSDASGGAPVYALVTDGPAEWVGWQSVEGRAMYPRPVGRMACAVDPLTATARVFSMADSWQPPEPMDGCPASPILRYAGEHQVGGPGAFILLPFDREAWWSKTSVVLRVRIAPSPAPGARVTATARTLDGSRLMSLPVDSPPIPESRPPTSNHYLWLRPVRFPTDGCWLVTVAVDGVGVGSAILPITAPAG